MSNIQELERSNKKLKELNAIKDRLIAAIAHDLRNPLYSITSLLEMFLDEETPLNETERKTFLINVIQSAKTANSLLNDLMYWAEYQMIDNPVSLYEEINLWQFVEECLKSVYEKASLKSIELCNNIEHNIYLNVETGMMSIVLRNLLTYAIKFTGKNGKIELSCKITDCFFELTVSDNGIGISQNECAGIFNFNKTFIKFGTNCEKESGIGLVLCRDLVEKNRGRIWVESQLGKGSDFKINFPRLS